MLELELQLSALLTSLVAGGLTVLAPCVLPLLPVIIGGSAGQKNFKRPLIIIGSLLSSIIIFTLLLKASTSLLFIPDDFWKFLSGGILLLFGIFTLLPDLWEHLVAKLGLNKSSNSLLAKAMQNDGVLGPVFIGAALGPIFSSCTPTYLAIATQVIPASYSVGMVYLLAFIVGLGIPLVLIAFVGQRFTAKLSALSNPKGWFKRIIAVIFIVVGVAIITGLDKDFEAWLIDQGVYDGLTNLQDSITGSNN